MRIRYLNSIQNFISKFEFILCFQNNNHCYAIIFFIQSESNQIGSDIIRYSPNISNKKHCSCNFELKLIS